MPHPERQQLAADRRVAALFVTKDGAAMLGRLDVIAQAQETRFLARVGHETNRAAPLGLLRRISDRHFDPP